MILKNLSYQDSSILFNFELSRLEHISLNNESCVCKGTSRQINIYATSAVKGKLFKTPYAIVPILGNNSIDYSISKSELEGEKINYLQFDLACRN
jgi:hypothetical protein